MIYQSKLNLFAHTILSQHLQVGDLVFDATCGNGYDTLKLAELVAASGKVVAFDLQIQAIENTQKLLLEHNLLANVQLVQEDHSNFAQYFDQEFSNQKLKAAVFNLGFLPRSDKSIITQAKTTLQALEQVLERLDEKSLVLLHTYTGHTGALAESQVLLDYTQKLVHSDFEVQVIHEHNKLRNPEYLIVIYKHCISKSKRSK